MDKPINILGVDDRPENLLALEAVLDELDVNLVKAHSGQEALEYILKQEFALVLMDVQMPEMDGFETADVIRSSRRTGHIPIIFITAISFERKHVFKGYNTGAVDYLFKPIDPGILRSKVTVFIDLYRHRESLRQKAVELARANEQILAQQKALEQSEMRFRTAFNQSFQFMVILDPTGRVVEVNELALRLSGSKAEDVYGEYLWNAWRFGSDEERQSLEEGVRRAAGGDFTSDEATFYDDKGMMLYFLRTVSPVRDESGKVVYITVQGQNITKRKLAEEEKAKLENQLRQAQKMEALGTLAGGIAHDFNNSLSVILGYADMGKRMVPEDTKGHKYLSKILLASNRARDLVRQILCFSRKGETEEISFRPSPIIREALKMLRATIPATIEIREDIYSGCGAVFADPTQYHQILINLCTNAYQAMETTGGLLEVSLKETVFRQADIPEGVDVNPGTYAHLSVKDTGHGMSDEVLEKMFDPYFTTKGVGKGTGLGLSIVHGIVKRHKGFIHVDSEEGRGTLFHVHFPVVAGRGAVKEERSDESLARGKGQILLVDDEEGLLEMASEMIGMMGYQVTCCRDSEDALDIFRENPERFDLVFTDQIMPKLTGMELAARMLEIRPGLPVVLCTGHSPEVTPERVVEMGLKDLVIKPLEVEDLGKVIRKALKKE